MIPEREREALMRLTMCARKECGMCKYQGRTNDCFEIATNCMHILADALEKDRKTEPQSYGEVMDKFGKSSEVEDEPQTDCAWR